jgi:hypothetical protein
MKQVQYSPPTPRSRKKMWILVIGGIVGLLIVYFAGPVLMVMFVAQPVRIVVRAMEPALKEGDRVFIIAICREKRQVSRRLKPQTRYTIEKRSTVLAAQSLRSHGLRDCGSFAKLPSNRGIFIVV